MAHSKMNCFVDFPILPHFCHEQTCDHSMAPLDQPGSGLCQFLYNAKHLAHLTNNIIQIHIHINSLP